jgi:hypothetical protein
VLFLLIGIIDIVKNSQKIATKVFIFASLLFGIVGITAMLSTPGDEDPATWIMKLLGALGFVVLSSFGVSVGLKYLSDK